MPRYVNAIPKYRKHRASGQAVVTLNGKDHYLGPHQSKASKLQYDRLIAEFLANGRRPAVASEQKAPITVLEVLAAYWKHARGYYRKNGKPTSELEGLRLVIRDLKREFAELPAEQFGPLALKRLREGWIARGLTRSGVNRFQSRVTRIFRWAAGEELTPPSVWQALAALPGLRKGRSAAAEPEPVLPVSLATVEQTLPHLPPIVADMVRLQWLTGCRPGELCLLRPRDVDRTSKVWEYVPSEHKTEHHARRRVVFIGPEAQKILAPYLLRDSSAYCFSPSETVETLRKQRHAARVTPLNVGNRPGKRSGGTSAAKRRSPQDRYDNSSFRRAVARACDKAFPPPEKLSGDKLKQWQTANRWSPNQLRHAAATRIRKEFGLEAAQIMLGHSQANVTEIYAERDCSKAREVAARIG